MASDALSSTGTSPQTALRRKYEALSGRTPSAAESEVLTQLCAVRLDDESKAAARTTLARRAGARGVPTASKAAASKSKAAASKRAKHDSQKHSGKGASVGARVQLAGARPEALAHLALALSADARSVLFVSPHEGLLHERHHKFSRRAASRILRADADDAALAPPAAPPPVAAAPGITWCSVSALAALVAREEGWVGAIGGYDLVVIEAAEGLEPSAQGFSPLLIRLGRALETELSHVPALFGSAYHAKLPALRLEEALPTSMLIVREAEGLDLSAELERLPRPLLALCSTPAEVDAVFAQLSAGQVPVHRYHRGMSRAERARELVRFALPGRRAILVATSGLGHSALPEEAGSLPLDFGRGYARGDLRSIVHLSVPLSLSEYTAELGLLHPGPRHTHDAAAHDDDAPSREDAASGSASHDVGEVDDERAFDSSGTEHDEDGDDGPERVAVLYVDRSARSRASALLARRRPEPAILLGAHAALGDGPLAVEDLARRLHHAPPTVLAALRVLVEAGLARQLGGAFRLLDASPDALEPWLELASDQSGVDAGHNDLAWSFALGSTCRTVTLADALGFPRASTCRCDVCTRGALPHRRLADMPTVLGTRSRPTSRASVVGSAAASPASLAPVSTNAVSAGAGSVKPVQQRLGQSPRGPGVIRAVSRARG